MILVVGGIASGKRTYARSLGFPEAKMAFDVHERLRAGGDADALVEELAQMEVVTCAEVGNGVVPLDRGERAWREATGRMAAALAQRAGKVVRMVCGIPVVLAESAPAEGHVELVLVRHGQTPGNGERRYVGTIDQPLSDVGRAQAEAARWPESVERVYVSSLIRTHETAALMFPGARLEVVDGIQEMDFGAFAGRTADEMADDPDYRSWVEGNCEGACPGGESKDQLTKRVCAAMEALLRRACARGEKRVFVVAHGGTMMASLSQFGDGSKQYYEWLLPNCAAYRIDVALRDDGIAFNVLEAVNAP